LRVIIREAVFPVNGIQDELTQLPVLLVEQMNPERPTLSLQIDDNRQEAPAMVVLAPRLEQRGGIRSPPLPPLPAWMSLLIAHWAPSLDVILNWQTPSVKLFVSMIGLTLPVPTLTAGTRGTATSELPWVT
jgi:hypothetical protein